MNCQPQQACDLQSVGGFGASLHFPVFLLEPLFLFQSVPLNLWVGCPQDNSPAKIVHAVVFIILSRAHADWEFVQGDGVSVKIFHHLSRAGTQNLSYFSILNLVGWEWAGSEWDGTLKGEACLYVLFQNLCKSDFSKMYQQDRRAETVKWRSASTR